MPIIHKRQPLQMAHYHMRRPDNGNYLDSGELRGNMRVLQSDEKRKTLDQVVVTFIKGDAGMAKINWIK